LVVNTILDSRIYIFKVQKEVAVAKTIVIIVQ